MKLTIAELAASVNRSDAFVRQHIHRGHLAVSRNGHRVSVEFDEAKRWATKRNLQLQPPARIATVEGVIEPRAARITVLVLNQADGHARNLFTLMRHRRLDSRGPWLKIASKKWRVKQLTDSITLFIYDALWEDCQVYIESIFSSGMLVINNHRIEFALESTPRRHWAYRDQHRTPDSTLVSPFRRHSAEILEYWSFNSRLRRLWRKDLEQSVTNKLSELGFPLGHRSDRVGNLMIAKAEDSIACDLSGSYYQKIILQIEASDVGLGTYVGTVWARHSGDEVFQRKIEISTGRMEFDIGADMDMVGCAVYRVSDGRCIDLQSYSLIMQARLGGVLIGGPPVNLKSNKSKSTISINPSVHRFNSTVEMDEDSPYLDRSIRQQQLEFLSHCREQDSRRNGILYRFGADQMGEALNQLRFIITEDSEHGSQVYFGDPYFLSGRDFEFWLKVVSATGYISLRILCCWRESEDYKHHWARFPKALRNHMRVRVFRPHQARISAFHDRFLITPKREILITHSVNGWDKHGVTFVNLPLEVYRSDAASLWNLEPESPTGEFHIEELR